MEMMRFVFPSTAGIYFDDFLVLGEGFRSLEIPYCANVAWWKDLDGTSLFSELVHSHETDCSVEIHSYRSLKYYDEAGVPRKGEGSVGLERSGQSTLRVLIDLEDGYETPSFGAVGESFDLILRCKFNRRCFHPSNHRPWAMGFSNRVSQCLPAQPLNFAKRRAAALINFGASHGYAHGTRDMFAPRFVNAAREHIEIDTSKDDLSQPPGDDWDRLMWTQTQRRHCAAYYSRLASSQVVAAFCGEMIPAAPYKPQYLVGGRRAALARRFYRMVGKVDRRPPRSIQWDSWRFWEGLAAGCLVFNIDLDYYGVELPVMPINGVHYVGLRYETIESQVHEVLSDADRMAAIAEHGRSWAYEHYSSVGLAKQFLKLVGAQPN